MVLPGIRGRNLRLRPVPGPVGLHLLSSRAAGAGWRERVGGGGRCIASRRAPPPPGEKSFQLPLLSHLLPSIIPVSSFCKNWGGGGTAQRDVARKRRRRGGERRSGSLDTEEGDAASSSSVGVSNYKVHGGAPPYIPPAPPSHRLPVYSTCHLPSLLWQRLHMLPTG